jgi:hypothetical protein
VRTRFILALSFAGGVAIAAGGWLFAAQEPPQRSAAELMDAPTPTFAAS